MDDKNFVLLRDSYPITYGEVSRRIFDGRVSDTGRFALQLIGKTGATTLCIFDSGGQEYRSRQFRKFLQFYDLSPNGELLFWGSDDGVHCTELATMTEIFCFELQRRFYPTGARLDQDGVGVLLQHGKKGWYRFDRNGNFPDSEKWFQDYIQDCSGEALYQALRELRQKQGLKDAQEAQTYAEWTEEAIRRGIQERQQTLSQVYDCLAFLYTKAGNPERAAWATEQAELHLDGFILVDRAISRFESIGNPPDLERAKKLVADLDRATKTQRLFEYPNYVVKLYRTKGEILELLGETEGAIAAYRKALETNPKAGCMKRLEQLLGEPIVLPEKPKPKPSEERVQIQKLTMFHFRCPVCGGTPKETPLVEYLAQWEHAESARFENLFGHLAVCCQEVRNSNSRGGKKFQAAVDGLLQVLSGRSTITPLPPMPLLVPAGPTTLLMQTDCPVCCKSPGKRSKDNYFTVWSEACGVQTSNLFYELGVILVGFRLVKLQGMSDDMRQFCETVRPLLFRTGEAIGMMSCPQCGRFTTCIYGGSRANPEKGMCRWCLDASGGIWAKIA
jgi:tetratricopeptide (TPR) repeat protein